MKNTDVSFKGLYYRSTSSYDLSPGAEFNDASRLRVKFSLTNDEYGNNLAEFKRTIANTKLKSLFASDEFENVFLDIEKSKDANEYGYSISLSGEAINQQDEKSLFGILTFLCAVTKFMMRAQSSIEPSSIEHIKLANNILDKVARRALKL